MRSLHPVADDRRETSVRVSHLSTPKQGERANGDRVLFREGPAGQVWLGIIDGLGHGPGASEVATMAMDVLTKAAIDVTVEDIMLRLHKALHGTRGIAATVCTITDGQLRACGVGNVELRCVETSVPFVLSPGILGLRVPRFRTCQAKLLPKSRIVMFSDGISSRIRLEDLRKLNPEDACGRILQQHRRATDDATVLIADFG
jgi:hypothetical protein